MVFAGVLLALIAAAMSTPSVNASDAKTVNDRAKAAAQSCASSGGAASWKGTEITCKGARNGSWKCELGGKVTECSKARVRIEIEARLAPDAVVVADASVAPTATPLPDDTLITYRGETAPLTIAVDDER